MRGNGSSGPFSFGAGTGRRLWRFPESLVGKNLQSALARLQHADPFLDPVQEDPQRRGIERAERLRAGLLAAADQLGRGGDETDQAKDPPPNTQIDLEAGLTIFRQALSDRNDLDEESLDQEVADLRDELATRSLMAGFDAAAQRAGLPGMEAFVAGADETLADSAFPVNGTAKTPLRARLRGRLQDQRHQEAVERVKRGAAARKAVADRTAELHLYLLDGDEAPADAREVLDVARSEGQLDAAALDRLDGILAERLSFERERDDALARIDNAIAGLNRNESKSGTALGIVEGDQPWLDCHFEHWLLARNETNKSLFKKLSYPPFRQDVSRRCLHRLTGWPAPPDIVAYSRAVGAIPPIVVNRITAQWEIGGSQDKARALEIADAIRNEASIEIEAPGLRKALSLVEAGSSPEQVVAHRDANPQSFQEDGRSENHGRLADTRDVPDPGVHLAPSATAPEIERGPEEGAEDRKLHELVRQQAEEDLAPESLPREDLAKRSDEGWSTWGNRIYQALVEAGKENPEETRKIARRFYGELHKPENADVLAAANQKVSLEAYLNPPPEQLIDGAELQAFKDWQQRNPDADPSEYGLYVGFAAYLGADGNFYRHSAETSKRTGKHAALLDGELSQFSNYSSVALGDYKHIWVAALEGGPSLGRGSTSFPRFGQNLRGRPSPQRQPTNQEPKTDKSVDKAEDREKWQAYRELIESEEAQKTPGIGFSLIKKSKYKTNRQLIKEWEDLNGKKWPLDPETGLRQHVHHIVPLADGGIDHVSNIKPLPKSAHIRLHKENGDSRRWGARRRYIEEILRRKILPFEPHISPE
ncbi:HNH endonuclease signature motif containing protein [Hwanghaeella sp.]|uniref:HNH endonuclease signature motif containing protein n=1 Tax=Hwanghaeella sp. TaxID=2605943 RepID=UPI003CCBC2D6